MTDIETGAGCKCAMKVERIIVRIPGIQGPLGNIPQVDRDFIAEKTKEAQDSAQSAKASASAAQGAAQESSESASSAVLSARTALEAKESSAEHAESAKAAQSAAEEARDAAKESEELANSKAVSASAFAEQASVSLSLTISAASEAKTAKDAAKASADESAESAEASAQSATSAQKHNESAKGAALSASTSQAASEEARDKAQEHEATALAAANEATKQAEAAQSSALASAASAAGAAESALEAATAESNSAKHESASASSAQAAQVAQTASEEAKNAANASAAQALESQNSASESARAASASAKASASSASEAAKSATDASASATASSDSATKAKAAQSAAESALSATEIARDDAQSWAVASAGSATSAASSATSASASKSAAEESASSARESAGKIEPIKASIEIVAARASDIEKVSGVAESVSVCAENIEEIAAAGGALGLTVSAETGETVGVEKTLKDGVYNLNFIIPNGGSSSDSVLFVEQTLTEEQKSQARTNISAVAVDANGNVSVSGELTANSVTVNGVTVPLSINGINADNSGNVDIASKFAQLNNSNGCPGFLTLLGAITAPSLYAGANQLTSSGLLFANGNFSIEKASDTNNYQIKLNSGSAVISAGTIDSVPGVTIRAGVASGDFKIRANGVLSIGDSYLPKTINGVAADASGNIEITTSGSSTNVFTEQVTFEQGCTLKKGFALDASTPSYDFGYNWDDGTGPGFAMRGSTFSGSGDGPGCFVFWARKDKGGQVKLIGSPMGSLQWNNGNVDVLSSVTKNTSSSQIFVIEHQNGFKEMAGYVDISYDTSPVTIKFPKAFNVKPNIQLTGELNDSTSSAGMTLGCFLKNVTTAGADIHCGSNNIKGVYWRASGF